jgi:hypothetical protein
VKWRGTEVSELDNETLAEAVRQCLLILSELIAQAQRRGLWGTPAAKKQRNG